MFNIWKGIIFKGCTGLLFTVVSLLVMLMLCAYGNHVIEIITRT